MAAATQSIRQIVAADPSAAAVFERFQIDLCSQADHALGRVCADLQLSVDQLLDKLAEVASQAKGAIAPDLERYSLTRLIQHIVRTHHQAIRQELPRFAEMAGKIAAQQNGQAPQFMAVARLIDQLRAELMAHIEKEEQALFPYIVELEEAKKNDLPAPKGQFRSVAQPLSMMIREHEVAEWIVEQLRQSTNGFVHPEWACPRNVAFHADLAAFDKNLRRHVQLENDLLFPRAIALEAQLAQRR